MSPRKRTTVSRLSTKRGSKGFSLVELLVVVAVIGIIATLAIGKVSRMIENGGKVVAKRNAQTIAQVASAAQAAGNETIEVAADLDAAIQVLADSTNGMGGFSDIDFGMSELGTEEITKAKIHLTFVDGAIQYEPQN